MTFLSLLLSTDIDECASQKDDCDPLAEVCINTVGGYRCECQTGYSFDSHLKKCLGELCMVSRVLVYG